MLLPFDQLKLATFLERLPTEVKTAKVYTKTNALNTRIMKTLFPKNKEAYQVSCESTYYQNSPYPTEAKCTISFDDSFGTFQKNHDQIRIEENDASYAEAIYDAISYGKDTKILRSYNRHFGTDFFGNQGNIFDYYFSCTQALCDLRFSTKVLE